MAWWTCGGCNEECFEPCDCFGKNCVLELTVSGWEDNASTDCDGIADLTFNGTHDIGGESLMSTLPYGYECELAYSFDQPVLTKEVGGNCICKDQPALYTIYASLQCGGEGPDGFLYTLHLDFHVPVYDEDEGCSPAPCTIEPKWEIWTAEPIVLYEGPLSGNPVCKFDVGPIDIAWAASPSAQTTCGLGLDGTNITVSARMKLCDPPSGGDCTECCNEDADQMPDQIQVTVSGIVNDRFLLCPNCENIDGTYVLDRLSGTCAYQLIPEINPCIDAANNAPFFIIRLKVWGPGTIVPECTVILDFVRTGFDNLFDTIDTALYAEFCEEIPGDQMCSAFNNFTLVPCYFPARTPNCDHSGATATITAI